MPPRHTQKKKKKKKRLLHRCPCQLKTVPACWGWWRRRRRIELTISSTNSPFSSFVFIRRKNIIYIHSCIYSFLRLREVPKGRGGQFTSQTHSTRPIPPFPRRHIHTHTGVNTFRRKKSKLDMYLLAPSGNRRAGGEKKHLSYGLGWWKGSEVLYAAGKLYQDGEGFDENKVGIRRDCLCYLFFLKKNKKNSRFKGARLVNDAEEKPPSDPSVERSRKIKSRGDGGLLKRLPIVGSDVFFSWCSLRWC